MKFASGKWMNSIIVRTDSSCNVLFFFLFFFFKSLMWVIEEYGNLELVWVLELWDNLESWNKINVKEEGVHQREPQVIV